MCMSSVISARRRCDGRISESSEVYEVSRVELPGGLELGEEGLRSARIAGGVMESSIDVAVVVKGFLETFGVRDVARDMRRTRRGRICFPSDCV